MGIFTAEKYSLRIEPDLNDFTFSGLAHLQLHGSDPVAETSLQAVLEAAHWAPSWGNTQCWRFVVVRESEIKSKIADSAWS